MAQTQALIDTLKKILKAEGFTYRDVASGLNLSEASVKRLFAEHNFSLARLDQICQLIGMEISDLVKHMENAQQQLDELSVEQERELISDIKLLLVAFLVINGWRFAEIVRFYRISETEAIRYLAKLDRIKLIDLLPNNRIRLRISANFSWCRNGPIQQFFMANLQEDFLQSRFDDQDEVFAFHSGMLTRQSVEQLQQRLKLLAAEFHNLNREHRNLPITERNGFSLLVAFRQWRPDVFEKLRR